MPRSTKLTEEQEKFIDVNYNKFSCAKLIELVKCSRRAFDIYVKNKKPISKRPIHNASTNKIEEKGFEIISYVDGGKVKVICPKCNKEFITATSHIVNSHTQSCGCIMGLWAWKGTKNICHTFYNRLKVGAKSRDIKVEISIEDLEEILCNQNFKCALTGWDLKFGHIHANDYTMSVDRIDSKIGYTKDNIWIVHKYVNLSKQDFELDFFIKMCKAVSTNNEQH